MDNIGPFYQPQYGALDAWSTIAHSDYSAGTISVRERFKDRLNLDFNYTFSKSIDNASALQREGAWSDNMINATNTQRLGAVNSDHAGMGLNIDPQINTPSASFGTISQIQGAPRIMQMGLRYDFCYLVLLSAAVHLGFCG